MNPLMNDIAGQLDKLLSEVRQKKERLTKELEATVAEETQAEAALGALRGLAQRGETGAKRRRRRRPPAASSDGVVTRPSTAEAGVKAAAPKAPTLEGLRSIGLVEGRDE